MTIADLKAIAATHQDAQYALQLVTEALKTEILNLAAEGEEILKLSQISGISRTAIYKWAVRITNNFDNNEIVIVAPLEHPKVTEALEEEVARVTQKRFETRSAKDAESASVGVRVRASQGKNYTETELH